MSTFHVKYEIRRIRATTLMPSGLNNLLSFDDVRVAVLVHIRRCSALRALPYDGQQEKSVILQ